MYFSCEDDILIPARGGTRGHVNLPPCAWMKMMPRLKAMSPSFPCGNSEKPGPNFFNHQWNYDGTTASNLNPVGVFSILQLNQKFSPIYAVTIVILRFRNLIGTVGIAKFRPT